MSDLFTELQTLLDDAGLTLIVTSPEDDELVFQIEDIADFYGEDAEETGLQGDADILRDAIKAAQGGNFTPFDLIFGEARLEY